jgi:sulfate permease, SulP family
MSAKGLTGGDSGPIAALFATGSRDVFAGLVGGLVSIAYGLSFAALIFSGPLRPWLAYGIAATFLTMAVSAAIIAARSSLPFAIGGPDAATSAVMATLVASAMHRLSAEELPSDLLTPIMIVAGLAAAVTGLLLLGLGLARAGGAIRFIPYPVIGGFLGATGWLLVSGAVRVITDHGLSLSTIDTLLEPSNIAKLVPAIAIALAFYLGFRRRSDSPYVIPGIMLTGIAVAHIATALTGNSLAEAQTAGWMFTAPVAVGLTPSWIYSDLIIFPRNVLPALSGDLFAVMFVAGIGTLLNTTGLEYMTKREADLQRELQTVGLANLAAAAVGGFVSTITLNRTTLNYVAGARGRLSGLIVAAAAVLVLMADPGFLAYVPKFVLGGLLLYLGANLVYEWLVGASGFSARICLAARHHVAHSANGLHRRCTDRRNHRLRHLCRQREPRECNQIQFRRLRIPLLARSRAGGA